jgi:hypothetical protein
MAERALARLAFLLSNSLKTETEMKNSIVNGSHA